MTENGPTSLRQSAQQAILWSAGLNLFRDALQFGQMLVMARLLDPTTYGMAGMATTVINFISLASFQHVVAHVLQLRPGQAVNYHEHFTAGLVLNGSLFLLTNLVALGLNFTTTYHHLQPLLHVLSLTFLLSVPVDMRVKMLEREQNWHRLRSVQLGGIVVSVVSAIAMAAAGAGAYALIVPGLLASTLMMLDLFVVSGWRPQLQWNYASYRDTMRFGLHRAGSNAMNGGRALLQNTLITQNAHFAGLGLFSRAEGLANMFCGRIAQQATGALYPVVTRVASQSEHFQRISALVLRSVAWVVVPICVFLAVQATSVVHVLYGEKWLAVAPLLPLAMGCGLAISLGATAYSLLLANDQSRLCLKSDTAAFFIAALPMVVLIPFGLRPYLAGALLAQFTIASILVGMLIKTRGVRLEGLLRALTPPALSATLAAACMWLVDTRIAEPIIESVRLGVAWLAFTITYVVALRLFFRGSLAEIVSFLPGGNRIGRVLCL